MFQDHRTFHKIVSILFLQVVYTVLFILLLAIVASLTLRSDDLIALLAETVRPPFEFGVGIAISVCTTYASMQTLSRMFEPKDAQRIPGWLAAVSCGIGILFSIFGQSAMESLLNILIIPSLESLTAYLFLSGRHL